MHSGGRVLLIIGCRFHTATTVVMRSGGHILLIIRMVRRSTTKIFASWSLLSLPYLHANPTGTSGSARILHISPRLPPCQPTTTSVDQNAEACLASPPFVLAVFIPLHRDESCMTKQRACS